MNPQPYILTSAIHPDTGLPIYRRAGVIVIDPDSGNGANIRVNYDEFIEVAGAKIQINRGNLGYTLAGAQFDAWNASAVADAIRASIGAVLAEADIQTYLGS